MYIYIYICIHIDIPSAKLTELWENHHVEWEGSLFLWSFSIATLKLPEGKKLRVNADSLRT